jgi:hypothetical protein
MAETLSRKKKLVSLFLPLSLLVSPLFLNAASDDDEPINLSPVKKGETKPEESKPAPTSAPTTAPSPVATQAPTQAPTLAPTPSPRPTPRPKPIRKLIHIEGLDFEQDDQGLHLNVAAGSMLKGRISALKNPDRILVSFAGAALPGRKMAREIGVGAVAKARLAQHPGDEVWMVVDLLEPVAYRSMAAKKGFSLLLETGAKTEAPVSAAPHHTADLPKVDMMFFDVNVLFQGKQYDRFPCANFIYDKTDNFPLKRDFITTLVFHDGYGAFVGNLRIVDPKGNVIDHTKEPVAFNLFSELFDYSAEVPWKVEFPVKGFYTLILTLNGEDVLEHSFYVGHNDDKPEKK